MRCIDILYRARAFYSCSAISRCPVGYEPNAYYTKYMSIRSSISMAIIIISIMSGSRGSDDPFPFRLSHSILLPLNFYSFFFFSFLIISLSTLLRVCIAVCVCLSSAEVHAVRFRRRDELDREKRETEQDITDHFIETNNNMCRRTRQIPRAV
jgi:hypothetical protein